MFHWVAELYGNRVAGHDFRDASGFCVFSRQECTNRTVTLRDDADELIRVDYQYRPDAMLFHHLQRKLNRIA